MNLTYAVMYSGFQHNCGYLDPHGEAKALPTEIKTLITSIALLDRKLQLVHNLRRGRVPYVVP